MKDILIIGDTLAGWTAAALLSKEVGISVHIIDSKQHSQVSMGNNAEVLSPAVLEFHAQIGIDEKDLITKTGATFQLATHYINRAEKGYDFMHGYSEVGVKIDDIEFQHHMIRHASNQQTDSYENYSLACAMARNNKFVHPLDDEQSILSTLVYGLHIDRHRYKEYLKQFALKNGVQGGLVDSYTVIVENNKVKAIGVVGSERLQPEMFIDCTADGRILDSISNSQESNNWLDWSQYFLCDQVLRVCTAQDKNVSPSTQIQAIKIGYIKSIPLQDKIEHELYFNSQILSEQDALVSLQAILNTPLLADPEVASVKNKVRNHFWQSNCLALGRAAGIPNGVLLGESHVVQSAIQRFIDLFPQDSNMQHTIDEYNRLTHIEYERIRDFQLTHTMLTLQPNSQFWQGVSHLSIPEMLLHKKAFFTQSGKILNYESETFEDYMWVSFFMGLGIKPQRYDQRLDRIDSVASSDKISRIKHIIWATIGELLSHSEYLSKYCQPVLKNKPSSRVYL